MKVFTRFEKEFDILDVLVARSAGWKIAVKVGVPSKPQGRSVLMYCYDLIDKEWLDNQLEK